MPSATTGSGFDVSATTTASKSSYETATVSAGAAGTGLGLSSVSSSSKMSVNSSSGNKLVPGMPPGVANVLPAQYMIGANTPAGESVSPSSSWLCLTEILQVSPPTWQLDWASRLQPCTATPAISWRTWRHCSAARWLPACLSW